MVFHAKQTRDTKGDLGQGGLESKHRVRAGILAGLRSAVMTESWSLPDFIFLQGRSKRDTNQTAFPPPSSLTQPKIICLHCKCFIQISHTVMFFSTQFFREWGPITQPFPDLITLREGITFVGSSSVQPRAGTALLHPSWRLGASEALREGTGGKLGTSGGIFMLWLVRQEQTAGGTPGLAQC